MQQGYTQKPVKIGCDVWLASNVNILFGTSVGNCSIVAPNALVKGNFPANSVLSGVPALRVSERNSTLEPLDHLADVERFYQNVYRQFQIKEN